MFEVRANVLALYVEVLGDLLNASDAVRPQVYLCTTTTSSKDLLYLGKVLFCLCPKCKGVRLFDGIDLVLDLSQAIEDLLISIEGILMEADP